MKKVTFLGLSFCCIVLAGCNGEQNVVQVEEDITEVSESDQEVVSPMTSGTGHLSEIQAELIESFAKELAIDIEAIMLDSSETNGNIEVSCAINVPKETKIEANTVQQMIDLIMMTVSNTENASINENHIEITRDGEFLKKFDM